MDISEFENLPFIMNAMETENDCDVENVVKKNNIKLDVKFSSKDCISIMSMVENGLGVTILPELITKRLFNDIKAVPLNPPYKRTLGIGIYSIDSASPAAMKFIEFTKSKLGQK